MQVLQGCQQRTRQSPGSFYPGIEGNMGGDHQDWGGLGQEVCLATWVSLGYLVELWSEERRGQGQRGGVSDLLWKEPMSTGGLAGGRGHWSVGSGRFGCV